MGYTTEFKGLLKISPELTASQLAHMKKFLGEDIRDHKDWETNEWSKELYYSIDLQLTNDFSAIEWNDMEKSYEMVAQVNYLITQMRKVCKDFELSGKFVAQGEDMDDRWELIIGEDGFAMKVKTPPSGVKITCPHCEESFYYQGETKGA
jgi:hypothetical protein